MLKVQVVLYFINIMMMMNILDEKDQSNQYQKINSDDVLIGQNVNPVCLLLSLTSDSMMMMKNIDNFEYFLYLFQVSIQILIERWMMESYKLAEF